MVTKYQVTFSDKKFQQRGCMNSKQSTARVPIQNTVINLIQTTLALSSPSVLSSVPNYFVSLPAQHRTKRSIIRHLNRMLARSLGLILQEKSGAYENYLEAPHYAFTPLVDVRLSRLLLTEVVPNKSVSHLIKNVTLSLGVLLVSTVARPRFACSLRQRLRSRLGVIEGQGNCGIAC